MIIPFKEITFIIKDDKLYYAPLQISDKAFKNLPFVKTKEQFFLEYVTGTKSVKTRKKEFDEKYLKTIYKKIEKGLL